jgi:hypothetical protein
MSADSKMIAVLKAEVAALKARVELLEETRAEPVAAAVKVKKAKKERDPDAPKKEPNSWIKFTTRVNEVLNENEAKLPGAEQKQFCSSLKDALLEELGKDKKDKLTAEDYESISAETILSKRETWVKPAETKWDLAHPDDEKVKERKSRKSSVASGTESDASAASAASEKKEVAKKGRGRPKKVKEADAPVPEPVEVEVVASLGEWKAKIAKEAEEAEEAEEEVIEDVELTTVNGKEYYKSEFNDLFDSDTMAYVGVLNGKKILKVPAELRVIEYLEKANM